MLNYELVLTGSPAVLQGGKLFMMRGLAVLQAGVLFLIWGLAVMIATVLKIKCTQLKLQEP